MIAVERYLRGLFGRKFGDSDFVAFFSARLDESGTDGKSPLTVLAGAVATAPQWSKLELAWGRMLDTANVSAFHWKEFRDGRENFSGWSPLRRKRFVQKQEKIIKRNTVFRISVGVESAVHADIKQRAMPESW